jgi:hypothetical protein
MVQNDTLCMSQILVHEAINKFSSLFDSAFYTVHALYNATNTSSQDLLTGCH